METPTYLLLPYSTTFFNFWQLYILCYNQNMSWIYLFVASIFEVGWPFGMKMASLADNKFWWVIFAIITMTLSGVFLYLAQKEIPVGTAYAIWTGIGAACTFIIGVLVFNDTLNLMRALGVFFIIAGVILLKFAH